MFGSVAFYNNQIFVADVNGNLISYEYAKFQKNDDQKFKENFRVKIPLPEQFHIKSIVLEVVDNFSSNLKCLTIVAISLYIDISVHIFCGNAERCFININSSDWLPLPNVEPNYNLFITHGPTLLFSSSEQYLFCNLPYKITSIFSKNSSNYFNSKIIHCASVGRLNIKNPTNVLLLIQSYESTEGLKKIHASSFGIEIKQKNSPVIHYEIPIHCFFPTHFQNSTEMVYVWNISIDEKQSDKLEDVNWNCNYSFLCTKTDSLLFCNGTLKYIFENPGLNLSCIKIKFHEMFCTSIKLIIASQTKDVYLVTSEGSSPLLQLNKTWEDIEHVVYGDILMNGSMQMLLLKNTSYDKWQDECILSDISDIVPVDYIMQNKETECSINRAMPGIQAKITAGKAAITNTKLNIEKKMEATLDSLCKLNSSALVDVEIDHHISSFRESLVDIVLSKDEVKHSKKDDENKVKLSIQKHWKQLSLNHLVLFWTFANIDDRIIYNPVLNMWVSNHHIQCFQRVLVHKSHTYSIEDEFKKQVNPKESFTVIASFDIPEFPSDNLAIQAVLSWYNGTHAEFENELYLPLKEKKLTQQQMCLQTNISSDEFLSVKLKDISSFEDLLCVKIFQQRIVFTILSLVTDLCCFEDLIMSSLCHPNRLLLLKSSNTKVLVFCKANLPLFGVHFAFKTTSQTSVEIEVFTKNEKETALVEKYLYQTLPSDVLILANGIATDEIIQLKQQAVCCMKDELDLLLSMLNIHNVQEPVEKCDVQPGTVIISKEIFLRIRKALLKKECKTDNIMQILSRINFFRKKE